MPRPDRISGEERYKTYMAGLPPKTKPNTPLYITLYEEAKLKKHWIYDPDIKRWQSPEEFLELEKRISGGEPNRLSRLQVKDPIEGIEAGYLQMKVLKERMEIFVKRVIEYYKH
ncbi:hypothetical protein GM921_15495 [Pedobacter sp. LMG 31464]|uniref:Uncharacterized protein n=1 Tax=Pedobacter planticolens TaxID=2679964 RepID=A0A923IWH1_9SPHI|nr:hypothetical protein [Pedobacter planticolens]MBB2146908.1 hypothetical protein [Pedobacter planticolens]